MIILKTAIFVRWSNTGCIVRKITLKQDHRDFMSSVESEGRTYGKKLRGRDIYSGRVDLETATVRWSSHWYNNSTDSNFEFVETYAGSERQNRIFPTLELPPSEFPIELTPEEGFEQMKQEGWCATVIPDLRCHHELLVTHGIDLFFVDRDHKMLTEPDHFTTRNIPPSSKIYEVYTARVRGLWDNGVLDLILDVPFLERMDRLGVLAPAVFRGPDRFNLTDWKNRKIILTHEDHRFGRNEKRFVFSTSKK